MQKENTVALSETLVATFLAYSFLGKAFFEAPSITLLTTLKDENLFADWPLDGPNDTMQTGLDTLQQFLRDWDEADFSTIRRDHARLFIGPNKLPAPPWESVYRSVDRLIFDKETFQVRALYRQFGMTIPSEYLEPDDHFGLEMLFVAHLCRLALNAIEADEQDAVDLAIATISSFFEEHICAWADEYLTDFEAGAKTPYYQGLAQLASGCIARTTTGWQIYEEAEPIA